MNNIIIAIVAWYIAEGCGLVQKLIHSLVMNGYLKTNRMKPLDCPMCMAFWIGIVFFAITAPYECGKEEYMILGEIILNAILCSSGAILISKVYNRL